MPLKVGSQPPLPIASVNVAEPQRAAYMDESGCPTAGGPHSSTRVRTSRLPLLGSDPTRDQHPVPPYSGTSGAETGAVHLFVTAPRVFVPTFTRSSLNILILCRGSDPGMGLTPIMACFPGRSGDQSPNG